MDEIGLDPSNVSTRLPSDLMNTGRTRQLERDSSVRIPTRTARGLGAWWRLLVCVVVVTSRLGECEAQAQGSDPLLNGAVTGAAVGAGAGIPFTHAVRDSDLGLSQYAYGALVFGALGAGVGVGIDALLNRASPAPRVKSARMVIVPTVWRGLKGLVVNWTW
jgi:hypothetical protein